MCVYIYIYIYIYIVIICNISLSHSLRRAELAVQQFCRLRVRFNSIKDAYTYTFVDTTALLLSLLLLLLYVMTFTYKQMCEAPCAGPSLLRRASPASAGIEGGVSAITQTSLDLDDTGVFERYMGGVSCCCFCHLLFY